MPVSTRTEPIAFNPEIAEALEPYMDKISAVEVASILSQHSVDLERLRDMHAVRVAAARLIGAILKHCPAGSDRSCALRHAREAIFNANASIVLKGRELQSRPAQDQR